MCKGSITYLIGDDGNMPLYTNIYEIKAKLDAGLENIGVVVLVIVEIRLPNKSDGTTRLGSPVLRPRQASYATETLTIKLALLFVSLFLFFLSLYFSSSGCQVLTQEAATELHGFGIFTHDFG